MKNNINSLVKLQLENELLARGTQAAVNTAKTATKITVGVPAAIVGVNKLAQLTGKTIT